MAKASPCATILGEELGQVNAAAGKALGPGGRVIRRIWNDKRIEIVMGGMRLRNLRIITDDVDGRFEEVGDGADRG